MKLKVIDWGAIIVVVVFIFIFPPSNGAIAMGIDVALSQISLIGANFIQVPATIIVLYIGHISYKFVKRDNSVKIPKKSAKTKTAGEFIV